MYLKMSISGKMFSPKMKPLCVTFHGLYLNQGVEASTDSGLQRDGKDDVKVFNAVVPFSDFTIGDLLLWGLKLRVQLCCYQEAT